MAEVRRRSDDASWFCCMRVCRLRGYVVQSRELNPSTGVWFSCGFPGYPFSLVLKGTQTDSNFGGYPNPRAPNRDPSAFPYPNFVLDALSRNLRCSCGLLEPFFQASSLVGVGFSRRTWKSSVTLGWWFECSNCSFFPKASPHQSINKWEAEIRGSSCARLLWWMAAAFCC